MKSIEKLCEFISIVLIGLGLILVVLEFGFTSFLSDLGAHIGDTGVSISLIILSSGLLIRGIIKR